MSCASPRVLDASLLKVFASVLWELCSFTCIIAKLPLSGAPEGRIRCNIRSYFCGGAEGRRRQNMQLGGGPLLRNYNDVAVLILNKILEGWMTMSHNDFIYLFIVYKIYTLT